MQHRASRDGLCALPTCQSSSCRVPALASHRSPCAPQLAAGGQGAAVSLLRRGCPCLSPTGRPPALERWGSWETAALNQLQFFRHRGCFIWSALLTFPLAPAHPVVLQTIKSPHGLVPIPLFPSWPQVTCGYAEKSHSAGSPEVPPSCHVLGLEHGTRHFVFHMHCSHSGRRDMHWASWPKGVGLGSL